MRLWRDRSGAGRDLSGPGVRHGSGRDDKQRSNAKAGRRGEPSAHGLQTPACWRTSIIVRASTSKMVKGRLANEEAKDGSFAGKSGCGAPFKRGG